jgi:hypothetical protein
MFHPLRGTVLASRRPRHTVKGRYRCPLASVNLPPRLEWSREVAEPVRSFARIWTDPDLEPSDKTVAQWLSQSDLWPSGPIGRGLLPHQRVQTIGSGPAKRRSPGQKPALTRARPLLLGRRDPNSGGQSRLGPRRLKSSVPMCRTGSEAVWLGSWRVGSQDDVGVEPMSTLRSRLARACVRERSSCRLRDWPSLFLLLLSRSY